MIDAHLHLFDRDRFSYPWMDGKRLPHTSVLDETEPSADVRPRPAIIVEAGVRADQAGAEVAWIHSLADLHPEVLGMVAAIDFDSSDYVPQLKAYAQEPIVVGVRHNFEGLPAGGLNTAAHRDGIAASIDLGLTVDLCVRADQLVELARCLRKLQIAGADTSRCVLDHLGKPLISRWGNDGGAVREAFETWSMCLQQLAADTAAAVKISGLGGQLEGAPSTRQLADALRTYGGVALEFFGPERVMVGSDHPVSTFPRGLRLADWDATIDDVIRTEWSQTDPCHTGNESASVCAVKAICEDTARRFYLDNRPVAATGD